MNPVIGSILRSALLAAGSYLAVHYGVDKATVDAATDAVLSIGGALAAGGAAIWSLFRAIKQHKANKGV